MFKKTLLLLLLEMTLSHAYANDPSVDQVKLVQLGYDSGVAERIVKYRPDLNYLIQHPEISIDPSSFIINGTPFGHRSVTPAWLTTQLQNRGPITVYRG